MKNKKFLSVLLCLALLASLPVLPGGAAAAETPDNGMKISKTATPNDDGTYTITLEAYATGSKVTTTVKKDIPTDIILVLDQSGSMADDIGKVSFDKYENEVNRWGNITTYHTRNQDYYEYRHNGGSANLWHMLEDKSYVSVSVTKSTALSKSLVNYDTNWRNDLTENCYYYYRDNLYEKVGDEYKKVTLTRDGDWWNGYTYTYTFSDGTTVSSKGNSSEPDFGSHAPLYTPAADGTDTVYTYTYTDSTGAVQTIGTSTGANTVYTPAFYQRSTTTSGGGSRLAAIKSAAETFVNSVTAKAKGADGQFGTDDDVNHRIAVVGFASESGYGDNTELLSIAGNNSGSVGVAYNDIEEQNLKDVMQSMDTSAGQNMVSSAINALAARGATKIDLGMDMAKRILDANPVPKGQTRNRVVIVFTDGAPTNSNGFERAVANSAISTANAIKAGGTTVYSIGIFSGADASTAGKEPVEDYYEDYYRGPNYTDAEMSAACNWFMQKVSSNNGTPRTPSYYLSAGDAASLNNIFQQISDQIQDGSVSTTLDENTVIKDIVSPSFVLKEGNVSDIALETYACTGVDENGNRIFAETKNKDSLGERVELISSKDNVSEDNPKVPDQVNVTGFDFSENWCGTETVDDKVTYRGNKLVIKITVKPRPGFFGGNGVTTNTSAGVYENATAEKPTFTFEQPKVNVPLVEVDVKAPEANVYLGAHLNETVTEADVLKNGATVKIGDSTLDFSQENYGLKPWQNEYVNIEASASTSGSFENMTEDAGYTVAVKVTPKTPEGAEGIGDSATGTIHVFKPELTFKDSEVKYMVDAVKNPDYFIANNKVGDEVWKNGDRTDTSDGVTMLTNKPTLALTYTPASGALRADDGLVISPDDIPVAVTVGINGNNVTQYTTFVHQACNPACGWTNPMTPGNPAFRLHVKDVYADLTITKSGADETADPGQSFLFTVTGPDNYSTEVIIVGNGSVTLKNLKIGTYTVTEDTSWSWRYTPTTNNNPQTITLEANGANTVTINNSRNEDKWLDGNAYADNKFTGAAATTN